MNEENALLHEDVEVSCQAHRQLHADPAEVLLENVGFTMAFTIRDSGDWEEGNTARAGRALDALRLFGDKTGMSRESPVEALGDLLCDLRHLCDALGMDYGRVDAHGREHYEREIRGLV